MRIGIDLGTSFSLIGQVDDRGVPALFSDHHESDRFQTPSIVHVGRHGALVGRAVEDMLEDDPSLSVVRHVKLRMGSPEPALVDDAGRTWPPETISALILRKILRDAEASSHESTEAAVIGVPAQFADAERRATKTAALLAGLPEPTLVEEPIAAATYYGMAAPEREETLFVYDLGGGTFDATLLQASPDGLYVIATDGLADVGGKRFDEAIMSVVADGFRKTHGTDPLSDPAANFQLRRHAEAAKIELGKPGKERVSRTLLVMGRTAELVLSRRQFESLIAPALEATLEASRRCLASAALDWPDIDRVLMTGGSTLVPMVRERIQQFSGKEGSRIVTHQPHHAVCYGLALVARSAGDDEGPDRPLVHQIATYDLGMRVLDRETGRPGVHVLLKRNTPLPAKHQATFYTTRDDQTRMVLDLVQTKGDGGSERSLGHFAFGPITEPRKNYPVEITIAYDLEGIVKVTARDPRSGRQLEREIADESQIESARLARWRQQVMNVRINE